MKPCSVTQGNEGYASDWDARHGYGRIDPNFGPYNSENATSDYTVDVENLVRSGAAFGVTNYGVGVPYPHYVERVYSGDASAAKFDRMLAVGRFIAAAGIPYKGYYQNSNSYAASLLQSVDLGISQIPRLVSVPGYETVMDERIHTNGDLEDVADAGIVTPSCFPAGTPIELPNGRSAAIETLRVGDLVMAFDPNADRGRGALAPKRITRLFENATRSWIKLDSGLTATPGHHFLAEDGGFKLLEDLVAQQGHIVLANGSTITARGEHVEFSAQTADQFEVVKSLVPAFAGSAALKLDVGSAWRSYNFEVEEFHTYVAGGIRVHNTSYFTANRQDISVGAIVQGADGYTWKMNADGSMTNQQTGHTTAAVPYASAKYDSVVAAEALQQRNISPSEQYEMASQGAFAHQQVAGFGPAVPPYSPSCFLRSCRRWPRLH